MVSNDFYTNKVHKGQLPITDRWGKPAVSMCAHLGPWSTINRIQCTPSVELLRRIQHGTFFKEFVVMSSLPATQLSKNCYKSITMH
uniref:Uncharacterized protein n=1 Tax=Panagrellus redivivus TaxID=6233 RepID=A0A7E4UUC0_PANRE